MKRLPSAKELQNKILIVSVRSSDEAIVEQKPEEVEEIDEYAFYGEVKRKRKPGPRNVKEEKAKKRLTLLPQWSKLVALEYITFTTIANMKRLASPWRLFNIGEKSLLSALERHPAVGDTGQRHERQAEVHQDRLRGRRAIHVLREKEAAPPGRDGAHVHLQTKQGTAPDECSQNDI